MEKCGHHDIFDLRRRTSVETRRLFPMIWNWTMRARFRFNTSGNDIEERIGCEMDSPHEFVSAKEYMIYVMNEPQEKRVLRKNFFIVRTGISCSYRW